MIRDNFADGLNIQLGVGAYSVQGNSIFAVLAGGTKDLVARIQNAVSSKLTNFDVAADALQPLSVGAVDADAELFSKLLPQGDFTLAAGQKLGVFSGIDTTTSTTEISALAA